MTVDGETDYRRYAHHRCRSRRPTTRSTGRCARCRSRSASTLIRKLAAAYGYDLDQQCRDLIMDWQELRHFAAEPLCTIGAHTVHHYELAKLPGRQARSEIAQSAEILEAQFGTAPHAPFLSRSAARSRPGRASSRWRGNWASARPSPRVPAASMPATPRRPQALPRVSLNGLFQSRRYVDVFATGAIFSAMGKLTG